MELTGHDTGAPEFYIPASSSILERRPLTLKQGDTFAMFDRYGDLSGGVANPEGMYHKDTRFLSLLRFAIEGRRPLLLSSTVQNNNALLRVDLTNPDIYAGDELLLARDSVHFFRCKFIWACSCYETIVARNFSSEACTVTVSLDFDGDFRDVFEVRGHPRPRRGSLEKLKPENDRIVLHYTGLDGDVRDMALAFRPTPTRLFTHRAEWRITLTAGARETLYTTAHCGSVPADDARFFTNLRHARRERFRARREQARVRTSNALFNELLSRSLADLAMLTTPTPYGRYPYAGVPWFSTAFGRDGAITAIEMLAFDPDLGRGVLQFLAATQAHEIDNSRDAEPGKILHEMRQGEMAALGEVPFGRYYGSVDSTPLFVLLAGLYWKRTGDLETIRALWPHILAALEWIDSYGDSDGDGLIDYVRKTPNGLANQGWKDSDDSIFHADGSLARGAIALCEVQSYVYAAKLHAAGMAAALDCRALAARLRHEAETLRVLFEESFWIEDGGYYAIALDGEHRPCRVVSSNMGHALFCGIAAPARAARAAQRITAKDMFSGWGIRTIGTAEARYNPMSYHNGSVWPHDNALVSLGLARYGHMKAALSVLGAIFDASTHMYLRRLPELFCGMRRRRGQGPTLYPVACAPQAWASAAPFALLAAAVGLQLDARSDVVRFIDPQLPGFIDELELSNIKLGTSVLDVLLHRRRGEGVAVTVLEKQGPANVEVLL
jgi:glycogen debranching enzyme